MKKILSIVIPTYNMQDYMRPGLDSLVVKEALHPILEVLVVNDGSKDNSSTIAHEYETKYPEVFRVIDKENGNYGSCVNRGLKEATGKYIKLMDADDWFDTEALEQLLQKLQEVDVDMVLTPFVCRYENGDEPNYITQSYLEDDKVYHLNECDTNQLLRYGMAMITYRKELLERIQYVQTEGISYTDTQWVFYPQYALDTFVWLPVYIYQYRIGREGQSMDPKVLAKNIWKYEVICRSLIDNANKYPEKAKYPVAEELNMQQIEFLSDNIYRMFLVEIKPSEDDWTRLKQFDAYLKEACPKVYDKVAQKPMKRRLPLRYVALWRKTGIRIPLDWVRDVYRKIKYGKK